MEHLIDLDDLAARLSSHIPRWQAAAKVGALTWRDESASWPQPIESERSDVEVPESVGLTMSTDSGDALRIVVWIGGWADAGMVKKGEVLTPNLTFNDTDEATTVVVSAIEDFLG